jgi:hypothetical protein
MAIFLFILLFLYLLYRMFRQKPGASPFVSATKATNSSSAVQPVATGSDPKWIVKTHTRLFERKTYIKGNLVAKFHGELDYIKDLEHFVCERYFDVSLYNTEITDAQFRRNNEGPFPNCSDYEKLLLAIEPNPLPCSVTYQGVTGRYAILLHEVRLSNIDFNKYRLLHMEEDDLVFGTIDATVTGFLLEHFKEEYQVEVPVASPEPVEMYTSTVGTSLPVVGVLPTFTGKTKTENGYRWRETWDAGREAGAWTNPVYTRPQQRGCLGSVGIVFLTFFAMVFLAAIGAQGIYVLLLLIACGLVVGLFSGVFRPALWLLTAFMVLFGVASLFRMLAQGPDIRPVAFARDRSNETSFVVREWNKSDDQATGKVYDSLIIHHRVWKDYNDSVYEGDIWVRTTDMTKSGAYKNRLQLPPDPLIGYDRMLNALQAGDRGFLNGVYGLMDSIRLTHRLDSVGFAKTVVSFVQDIPYALVLDRGCNPDLYRDAFIRSYLQSANADCSGFQRFGINTPVEFMGTLKGDCDTRTLFLYTLLDHYGYDVAILSSEVYSHSLLGAMGDDGAGNAAGFYYPAL